MPRGAARPPNAGKGRKPGVPNKATADVRAVVALIAQRNVGRVEAWLNEIEDPAKRVRLFIDLIEYHIPKLSRQEHTGEGGGPVQGVVRVEFGNDSEIPPQA